MYVVGLQCKSEVDVNLEGDASKTAHPKIDRLGHK